MKRMYGELVIQRIIIVHSTSVAVPSGLPFTGTPIYALKYPLGTLRLLLQTLWFAAGHSLYNRLLVQAPP